MATPVNGGQATPLTRTNSMHAYRLITEDDTSDFCHRVSEALSNGWELYGEPKYVYNPDSGNMRCAQAVIKSVPEVDYSRELKLGAL
jgi:hypothetical protein